MDEERERLCLMVLTATPNTPDLNVLRDAAANLGVNIEEGAGRMAIVRAMSDYVTGGAFEALGDDVAVEALQTTLRMMMPPPPSPREHTPPPVRREDVPNRTSKSSTKWSTSHQDGRSGARNKGCEDNQVK